MGTLVLPFPIEMSRSVTKLKEDGCQLATPEKLFVCLYAATQSDPCTTGCAYFNGGKCPAYLKHHTTPNANNQKRTIEQEQVNLVTGRFAGIPIRKIAEMEGISIGEARRRKQAGQYAQ